MAQLALAVAGSVIGNAILPGIGGQIGFALGSALGAGIDAPNQQGPKLAERSVQVSSYSAAIAEVWGGGRLAGNLIWSTDLVETETTESAGKGGPELTTYSYSVSCAVAVCEGPIGGIRRIWADAKLVYDAREDADAATQAASAAFAAFMTVHLGTEAQMPDATIEAAEGVGNVEAYRGTAYIVFSGLPLGDYGNRVPNFSFEITSDDTAEVTTEYLAPLTLNPWDIETDTPVHGGGGYTEYTVSGSTPYTGPSLEDALVALRASFGSFYGVYMGYYTSTEGMLSAFESGAELDMNTSLGPRYVYLAYNYEAADEIISDGLGPGSVDTEWCYPLPCAGREFSPTPAYMASSFPGGVGIASQGHTGIARMFVNPLDGATPPNVTAYYPYVGAGAANYFAHCVSCAPNPTYVPSVYGIRHAIIRVERKLSPPAVTCVPGDPIALGLAELPENPAFCISRDGSLSPNISYTEEAGTFKQLRLVSMDGESILALPLGPVLRPGDANYSSSAFWTAAAAAAGVTGTYGIDFPVIVASAGVGESAAPSTGAGSFVLSEIVSDLCTDAGLTTGQIDVTALDDVVLGYQRTRVMSARAALEPLRQAYHFDAVESGDLIRFVKRGGASIATLTLDDLGAGQGEATEPIEHDRGQQTELPASVSVAYQSPTADFQVGVQQSRRRVGGSQQVAQVELPLVLQDLTAAQVCDVLLYDAWASRTGRKIAVTRAHAYVEPTDVITLDDGATSYRVRVVDKAEDGGVIRLECRDDDASSYSPNSTAGAVSGGGSTVRYDGPTALYLLDIPILRDADDGVGYYAAATGLRDTWRGSRAFRSIDDGVSYSTVRDLTARVVAGTASTALDAYTGGNTVDELHTVDVTILAGALSTITRAQLLAGGNACVLGDEVLQFQRAGLVTGTTYRLSGLLRGRVGTEQHMGTHAVLERFVLLSESTTYRIAAPSSEIGQASVWKAVRLGDTLADAYEVDFTNSAAGALPLSPAHLFAADIGGGDYAVQWVRRTRIGGTWRDLVDAQLGETTEAYVVTVTRAGAIVSTATVTTQSATVEALAGDVITVAQISAAVGPGFASSITLT